MTWAWARRMLAVVWMGSLTACGGETASSEVPLPVLVNQSAAYDGERVATQGVVRHFDDPLHYWIEDEDLHRVEIFPHASIAPHLGDEVRVVGVFSLGESGGRSMEVEDVEAIP